MNPEVTLEISDFIRKGRLIKSLLEQFVTQKVIEYGGMEVETPIMYDFEHPSLQAILTGFQRDNM